MIDTASFAADLAEIVADMPVACNYRGAAFNATSTDAGSSRTVEIDGALFNVDRTIICAMVAALNGIAGDDELTVAGVAYRVLDVSRHQDGVGLEINLKAVTE